MGNKTYVNISTQRLLENKDFKHAYELAMQMHVYKQRKVMKPNLKLPGLAEELVTTYQAASHKKFKRLRSYAEKGKYEYGLPTSDFSTVIEEDMRTVTTNYLEGLHPTKEVIVRSYLFGDVNVLTAAWNKLISTYNYNGLTNELTNISTSVGKPCYLVDGQIVLSQRTLDTLATREVSTQVGLPFTSGQFFDRPQDFNTSQPEVLLGEEDKLVFRYGYKQDIVDTIAPPKPVINNITESYIDGYAEFDSLTEVSINGVLVGVAGAANDGYFNYVVDSPLTIGDVVSLVSKDGAGNVSSSTSLSYPYTNSNMAIEGSLPQGTKELIYITDEIGLESFMPDYGDTSTIPTVGQYVQVFYIVDNEMKLMNYLFMSGGIPVIDAVNIEVATSLVGKYYPSIYIRLDGTNLNKYTKTSTRRKASEKAMKMVGLNLDEFTEQVQKSIKDLNNEYKDMYISLGLHPKDSIKDPEVSAYMFSFFDSLFPMCVRDHTHVVEERRYDKEYGYYYDKVNAPDGRKVGISHIVKDLVKTLTVSFESIDKRILPNTVAILKLYGELEIGEVKGSISEQPPTEHLRSMYDREYGNYTELYTRDKNYYLTYVKRTGENELTEITIQRLMSRTLMHGKSLTLDSYDSNLIIPLDYAVVNQMTFKESEVIFNRALNITVSHMKVVKEKWYEKGVFKILMAVISVAMNVIVPGSGITLQAIMTAVVTTVLVGFAINIAISLLVKIAISLGISVEIVAVLAAILAVAAAAYGGGKFDFSKVANAKELMKALSTTLDAYQKGIQETIVNLQKEMSLFDEYMKDKNKQLEDIQEMLNTGFVKPSLELLTAPISGTGNIYLGESPEDFYTRTTNISVTDITLDIVNTFLDVTTQLPKKLTTVNHDRSSMSIDDVLLIT